jgi:ATP-binding cassette, subfamily B, bacterial HlyB/CyaB
MNKTSKTSQYFDTLKKDDSPVLPWLLKQIHWTVEDVAIFQELNQGFEIVELQLGDTLIDGINSSIEEKDYCYLICQGRIRILSFHAEKQREISIQLLEEGAIIGGDNLLSESPLAYTAIATNQVKVARITTQKLQPFLQKLPALATYWQNTSHNRQKLLFFKTSTVLHHLSSDRLQKLISYIKEETIAPGKVLAEVAPKKAGYFWLHSGKIVNQPADLLFSWGYPNSTPPDWISQSELLVYRLPKEDWEAILAIAPDLPDILQENSEDSTTNSSSNGHHPQKLIQSHPVRENKTESALVPLKVEDSARIMNFPQPVKHNRRAGFWHKYPFISQQSSSDCGAACLAMVSQYWGKHFSINSLRNLALVGRSGTSLKSLTTAAETLGYAARPVRASLNRLVEQTNPWIAHWEGDHYVVVYWVKGNSVLVADPAKGKLKLSREQFLAGWTGYGLLLEATERLYRNADDKLSLTRFFSLLLPYRSLGLQIILASVLIQLFGLVSPLFTQIILDKVVVSGSQSSLNVFVIGALIFGVWGIGLSATRTYLLDYLSNRLDLTMIGGFINHALTLPLKFFESRRVGDILTRVQENQKIQRFLVSQVLLSWLNLVSGFVYLGLMLYYNWQLTVLILGLIPPIVMLTLVATPLLRRLSRERFNATADQNSSLVEMMTGISTVKAAAAEKEFRWRWEDLLTHQINVQFKGQKLAINLELLSGLINTIGGTVLLWYGATLVIQGQLTIGQYVAFNMMKGNIISPVITLVGLWDELQEVLISVERLNDVLEAEPEENAAASTFVIPQLKGSVRFDNVTFRYETEEERNILQNISFEIQPGQTIAIVGRSGSGKSTLVKLLQGLYYPTSGHIWIDDHDIEKISPPSLRSQLGVVPQECFLFSGTILENITLYRPEFTLEQVIEVAKLAEAHSFIQAMPLGYNTKVGERGTNLSGGQRQRIAIARALLGEPRILILDEATSSLDTESERRFQRNLISLSRYRTTIVIAHRLSTVRNADCILVLDRGLLVEKGNHQELITQQGLYYYLAQQQINL